MRRLLFCVLLVSAGLVGSAAEARAQTRADSAAVLLHAAEQLRLRGEAGAARALLQLIESQFAGTPAALEVERMRVQLRRTPDIERSGRTELLVWGTTYGAWLGVALPLMFDSEEPESYGIGLLLGAPIAFFAAKSYADTYSPTEGQTRAITFGGTWGTFQGFMLAELFHFGRGEICEDFGCYETDGDGSAKLTSAVVTGLAGIATGAVIARKPITAGTAAAVSLSGFWGTWFGFGLGVLTDQDEGDGDGVLATTIIGGNAALIAAGLIAPRWQMSESRARLISLGGLVGGLGGVGLLLLMQPEDENTAVAIPLTTSAIGLAAAAHWTRGYDARASDGGNEQGALLNLNDRRWKFGTPQPSVQLQRGGGRLQPTAYVPLLRARF